MSTRRSARGTRSTRSSVSPSPQPSATSTRASRRSARRGGASRDASSESSSSSVPSSATSRRKRARVEEEEEEEEQEQEQEGGQDDNSDAQVEEDAEDTKMEDAEDEGNRNRRDNNGDGGGGDDDDDGYDSKDNKDGNDDEKRPTKRAKIDSDQDEDEEGVAKQTSASQDDSVGAASAASIAEASPSIDLKDNGRDGEEEESENRQGKDSEQQDKIQEKEENDVDDEDDEDDDEDSAKREREKQEKCAEWAAFLAKGLPRPSSLKDSLVEFYKIHNPSKIPDIDKVTDHYNVYGVKKLWKQGENSMHTRAYMASSVETRLDRMFSDINTHYGIPSSNPAGAKPRKPDTRTVGEKLSDATLTSAKPGGGRTPIPLKKGDPLWAHIFSFHNFCEYPTHILSGGIQSSSKDLGRIVHPEMELRFLCRGMYRALRIPRDIQVPGCGPWQRHSLESAIRLIKSLGSFIQMPHKLPKDRSKIPKDSRMHTHKPFEPGFWGPPNEPSSLGQRKVWERKKVKVNRIKLGVGRFQCETRKKNNQLGYSYTGWSVDFPDLEIFGQGQYLTELVGQFGVLRGATNTRIRDFTIISPKRDGLVVCRGGAVIVENCRITGCGGDGVSVHMGGAKVEMRNCRISHNRRYGIDVQGEGASADLVDVVAHHNGMTGLIVCNGAKCNVRGVKSSFHSNGEIMFNNGIGCGVYVEGPKSLVCMHVPKPSKAKGGGSNSGSGNRSDSDNIEHYLARDNAINDMETIVDGAIKFVSKKSDEVQQFEAERKKIIDRAEMVKQHCFEQGFARIPEDFRTLAEAAHICKLSEGKCMEIRVSRGTYRTGDNTRVTSKELELAQLALKAAKKAGEAAAGGSVKPSSASASSANTGAGQQNKYSKYSKVSHRAVLLDHIEPRLVIDFSGLRIVGAGAGGFADPYPGRVGPGKPSPGSFGMLEQGGGFANTTVMGGIEVTGEGVTDVVVQDLTIRNGGFKVSAGASALIRNCEVTQCQNVGTLATGANSRMRVENCRIHRNQYCGLESRGAGCEVVATDVVIFRNLKVGLRAGNGGIVHLKGVKTHIGRNERFGLYASAEGSKINIYMPKDSNFVHNNGRSPQSGAVATGAGDDKSGGLTADIHQDSGEIVYVEG